MKPAKKRHTKIKRKNKKLDFAYKYENEDWLFIYYDINCKHISIKIWIIFLIQNIIFKWNMTCICLYAIHSIFHIGKPQFKSRFYRVNVNISQQLLRITVTL